MNQIIWEIVLLYNSRIYHQTNICTHNVISCLIYSFSSRIHLPTVECLLLFLHQFHDIISFLPDHCSYWSWNTRQNLLHPPHLMGKWACYCKDWIHFSCFFFDLLYTHTSTPITISSIYLQSSLMGLSCMSISSSYHIEWFTIEFEKKGIFGVAYCRN